MKTKQKSVLFLAGLLGVALAPRASASTSQVNSRAALGSEDSINWGNAGPTFSSVGNPLSINSQNGLSTTVSMPSGSLERADEGNGWTGNFATGDALLWTALEDGPLALKFSTPVFGGGAQIQTDALGIFSGTISAFDASETLLASYPFTGNSTQAGDNSAAFVGIQSDLSNISRIEFNITATTEPLNSFAINKFDLDTSQGVPDAGSTAPLFSLGLLGIVAAGRNVKVKMV